MLSLLALTLSAHAACTFDVTSDSPRIDYYECLDAAIDDNVAAIEDNAAAIDALSSVAGGSVPLGTILAWHPDAVVPALPMPDGWAPCDGSTVSVETDGLLDPDGDGQFTTPDLNNTPASYNGGGRFLRGGLTSGDLQNGTRMPGFAEIGHSNELYFGNTTAGTGVIVSDADAEVYDGTPGRASVPVSSQSSSDTRVDAYRARPVNMSVVWIMRVE